MTTRANRHRAYFCDRCGELGSRRRSRPMTQAAIMRRARAMRHEMLVNLALIGLLAWLVLH